MEVSTQHNKLTKSKGKMVKPILKKLSHSEKNSLDLDRPWEEQQGPGLGIWGSGYDSGGTGRSVRDVSFAIADTSMLCGKPRFQHGRSPSGTSHISVATSGSGGGHRSGVYAHPFQPTPRTETPPMSYANSQLSLDIGNTFSNTASSSIRDYSPTITENEDDDDYAPGSLPNHRNHHSHAASISQSSLRRPSLVSQRAASFTDISAASPLRINTTRAMQSGPSTRRNYGGSSLASSFSQSDLHLSSTVGATSTLDSPASVGPVMASSFMSSSNSGMAMGSSSAVPMSPLRSSFEGVGFPRLRSRSEMDAGARTDQIREARRKFEERERAKAEKHDQVMLRKRERKDHKEAKELERQAAAQLRKNSGSDGKRPSLSRKPTPPGGSSAGDVRNGYEGGGKYSRQAADFSEKPLAFKSSNYDNMTGGTTPNFGPTVDSVAFKSAQRNNSTKRKTQSYWTGFILWLRTRLFHMGRR